MCKTKPSRIAAMKAAKGSEKPQCNELKEINGVYETIVDTHNAFSLGTLNNVSGQHTYVEILLNNIPVRMMVDSGSNVTLIPMTIFNKIKRNG